MNEIDLINKPLAQMMWTAPVSREDGTAFDASTEVGEYRIYHGSTPGDYQKQISIAGNTLYTDLDFSQLQLPMYAVMTTVDNDGRESTYSEEIQFVKKIFAPKPPTGLSAS